MAKGKRRRKNRSDDDDDNCKFIKKLKYYKLKLQLLYCVWIIADSYIEDNRKLNSSGYSGNTSRERKEVALVLAEDELDNDRNITWSSIAVDPSKLPRRFFCVVCGCFGKYRCYECYKSKSNQINRYVCSLRCYNIHKDVDCGKPKNSLIW
ncbi:uncharacterized protein CMU_034560 [Cryptosporidium muris RN66]|uniref:HIT-type domain-containing protein n=1 Tax=Cryptosporidium muris (strain RN66) TaxID=441375 RepID=B6AFS9_CRYMR|nr:uncharacterized protein CMU_034560 [Cryptosporidium muris RN66]EEA07070.1 hypothetical protein, conserved [Cryptosporidium muris RN66]|eukprot:XP_002141419.1 hypothetical protein [Cryptosporidium muris RN66]